MIFLGDKSPLLVGALFLSKNESQRKIIILLQSTVSKLLELDKKQTHISHQNIFISASIVTVTHFLFQYLGLKRTHAYVYQRQVLTKVTTHFVSFRQPYIRTVSYNLLAFGYFWKGCHQQLYHTGVETRYYHKASTGLILAFCLFQQ